MIGVRQRIGHMIVVGHPTNLDVWSVTIHYVLLVLQPANHNAGIRSCECWGNNNVYYPCTQIPLDYAKGYDPELAQ